MNLTEGQLLFRLQDFHGAEQEALGIGDYEFFQESADIANALRELLQARRTIEELTAVVGQRNGECVRLHSLLDAAEKRIAELEDAQCQHESDTLMLCHQFDELASAMGWTSELAMKQGVGQLEYARSIKARIAELEARTVVVKQFDDFQIVHYGATEDYAKGYIDCQSNYNKAIYAAGIKVKGE
ncbi:hypothetical protein CRI18_16270 [Salmonella enterica]|nr:hypothetical protein [Salmonella enterica]